MAIHLQAHLPSIKITSFSSILPPNSPFSNSLSFPLSSLKTHQHNTSLFSNTNPRRQICRPPNGKYIREDYLVKKKSAEEIQELVRGERNVPIIIDFYATWCGPCILMAQELEMLAVEYESNAVIVKVDTDDEYEFARDMQVRGLPTLYFISPDPNKDAIRTEGLIPIQMMRDILDKDM
ncbi:thioredoxin-like protein CITRX2, chloroplastic [Mercurialis annua]|uniref:thioredoxin-like protein CITRX2, chloroplastic n=1 Tax=Mercurialis annua TaxID=3986 RepID=UPI00215F0677|nr:thioredoxin-like protein CITRX2, chloroplastic [Mercurialis annua]